jgi:hypothetical protein
VIAIFIQQRSPTNVASVTSSDQCVNTTILDASQATPGGTIYIKNTKLVFNILLRPLLSSLHDRCSSKSLQFTTWSLTQTHHNLFHSILILSRYRVLSSALSSVYIINIAVSFHGQQGLTSCAKTRPARYVRLHLVRFSNMWSLLDFHESALRLPLRPSQLSLPPNLPDPDRTALHLSHVQWRVCRSGDN